MKRRIAAILSALLLAIGLGAGVVTAPVAGAISCDHTMACWTGWDGFHATGPNGSVPVTLAWLQNNIPGLTVGPGPNTGYGKENLGAFTKGCPECTWYSEDRNLTNHQPSSPAVLARPNAMEQRRDFCWPWDYDWFSGDACWNMPATWDWGAIWDNVYSNMQPDPQNWSHWVDWGKQCWDGVYSGGTFGVVGKSAIGAILKKEALVRLSPEGFWYSVVGGCAWEFFK